MIAQWSCSTRSASKDRASIAAVELSYGRKRALEIATTLALEPEMLLLDEPMAGMGRRTSPAFAALIKRCRCKPHRADGRAQPQQSSPTSRTRSRCWHAGEILAEGPYREGFPQPARSSRPIWARAAVPPMREVATFKMPDAGHRASERSATSMPSTARGPHPARHERSPCPAGEVVTLLGRNGAGKTTTMRAIMGLIRSRRGSIAFDGVETIALPRTALRGCGDRLLPGGARHLLVAQRAREPDAAPVVKPGG